MYEKDGMMWFTNKHLQGRGHTRGKGDRGTGTDFSLEKNVFFFQIREL